MKKIAFELRTELLLPGTYQHQCTHFVCAVFSFWTPRLSPNHSWWLGFTVVSYVVDAACRKNVCCEQLMNVLIPVERVHVNIVKFLLQNSVALHLV